MPLLSGAANVVLAIVLVITIRKNCKNIKNVKTDNEKHRKAS